jgi:hypothetical protein
MVKLTPEHQRELIDRHPDIFTPEPGGWGRSGCTRVQLQSADQEVLGEALILAWQNSISTGKATGVKRKPSTRSTRRSGKQSDSN